ncbi:MAG: ribonuclease J [Eubacteriales bacterium]|jgi:ribonuclease J|nr:ribonuclease J [Eubacteriales bacterium]
MSETEKTRKNRSGGRREQQKLRIVPLGGLHEIGKNMTCIEYGDEMIIIDCGMSFPEVEMYGIDVVIPDFDYIAKSGKKLRGVFITHGHEDHIGAVPYFVEKFHAPIYGTPLPLGLIQTKLEEHGLRGNLIKFNAGRKMKAGKFTVQAIRTTHSIADSVCYCIDTPVGKIFHTGDFKIDYTPVDGEPIDLGKLAEIGREGVLLMMADSTNAIRQGYTKSEKVVGETLGDIIRKSDSRMIIATFSSNVHRIQKIIDNAVANGRKVAVSGRSMIKVVGLAVDLGYLRIPKNTLVDINKTKGIPDNKLVIITTGSQGEPMSALARMATNDHKAVQIKRGDQIVLSSNPIPGNEKLVANVVNRLIEKGAQVIYSDIAETHVSGHACAEELKLIHSLIKPKYFMPVHGEFRHLVAHADIARGLGMPENRIFLLENGDCLELTKRSARHIHEFTSAEGIMVDGLGVGDVGSVVMRDRHLLSESGLIVVVASVDKSGKRVLSGPDIISRGFVYVRENEDLIEQAQKVARRALNRSISTGHTDWNEMKAAVRDDLRSFIYSRTERSPVILPIFMEV